MHEDLGEERATSETNYLMNIPFGSNIIINICATVVYYQILIKAATKKLTESLLSIQFFKTYNGLYFQAASCYRRRTFYSQREHITTKFSELIFIHCFFFKWPY